jgi:hypothetical protein
VGTQDELRVSQSPMELQSELHPADARNHTHGQSRCQDTRSCMSYAEFCALFHEHVDRYPPMPPKLNCKRAALFVLTKIDEILRWEKQKEVERNTRFVELFIASALGI